MAELEAGRQVWRGADQPQRVRLLGGLQALRTFMDARRHRHPEPGARPRDGRPDPSRDRRWRERAVSWAPFLLAPSLLGGCDDGEKPAATAPRARCLAGGVAAGMGESPSADSAAAAGPGPATI